MAFKTPYLIKLANLTSADLVSPTGGLYEYQTADAVAAVKAAGYFNARRNILLVGDIIMCDCNGVLRHLKIATVPADGVSNLTVTDMTSGGNSFVAGQAVSVTASDTIVTGLTGPLVAAGASLDSAPVLTAAYAQASIGDQAGAPAAGSILLQTYEPTSVSNPTPIAATTFGKKVNWWAYGKA